MRFKPAGTEMLPSPGYMALAEKPGPGTAYVYEGQKGMAGLIFDTKDVLCACEEGLGTNVDWELINALANSINTHAEAGLSIPQALDRVQEAFGKPDVVLPLPNINDPGDAIRATVESHR